MKSMPHAVALALASTLVIPAARAAPGFDAESATRLIRETVDKTVSVLKDPDLQGREKRLVRHGKLRKISDSLFDWRAMAQRSLGAHWKDLSPADRKRFTTTFKEILASHYLGQMDRFQGQEQVNHEGTDPIPSGGFLVKMRLVTPSRAQVPVHFHVREDKRVFDVSIEGVSISNHYRGSFNRELVNSSFDQMMKKLEAKLAVQRRVAEKATASGS